MKNFKYKTSFSSVIRCIVDEEKSKSLALAALNDLKDLIPESIRGEPDLLAVCGNAFTPNLGNKNGDMIDTATALKIYKSFIHRPLNINHKRNEIVGHIVSAGFSKFDINYATGAGSETLDEKDIKDTKDPFNVALSAVIYRVVNEELAGLIEDSNDPTSNKYLNYSYSWELGYNNFSLAVGSKDLKDCEIITDEAKIKDFEKFLVMNGGKGVTEDNKPIFKLIYGEVYPLGIAVTDSPAALLRGIVTDNKEDDKENNEEENDEEENDEEKTKANNHPQSNKSSEFLINEIKDIKAQITEITKNNFTSAEFSVKNNTIKNQNKNIMDKITKLSEITDETLKECKASVVTDFISEELKKASDKFVAEQEIAKNAINEKKAIEANFNKIQEDLKKLQDAAASKEAEELFNQRMTYFDDTYELSKEERQAIATEIKDADTDSFEKARSKFDIFLKDKSKEAIQAKLNAAAEAEEVEAKKNGKVFDKKTKKWVNKEDMKEEKKEESKASLDEEVKVIDDALKNGQEANAQIPNAQAGEQSWADKFKDAFSPENCVQIRK